MPKLLAMTRVGKGNADDVEVPCKDPSLTKRDSKRNSKTGHLLWTAKLVARMHQKSKTLSQHAHGQACPNLNPIPRRIKRDPRRRQRSNNLTKAPINNFIPSISYHSLAPISRRNSTLSGLILRVSVNSDCPLRSQTLTSAPLARSKATPSIFP